MAIASMTLQRLTLCEYSQYFGDRTVMTNIFNRIFTFGQLDEPTGDQWVSLIRNSPERFKQCPTEALSGENWARLLRVRPEFAQYCNWQLLTSKDWISLLEEQPQLACHCDFDMIEGSDWIWLLLRKPGHFDDHCRWDKIPGVAWAKLLEERPEFASKCLWEQMDLYSLTRLYHHQPSLRSYFDLNTSITNGWVSHICGGPENWSKVDPAVFSGSQLSVIFMAHPSLADENLLSRLESDDWVYLVRNGSLLSEHCPFQTLSSTQTRLILADCPDLIEKVDTSVINGADWVILLVKHSELAPACEWCKLNGKNWADLLVRNPMLAANCNFTLLSDKDWEYLLYNHPRFAKQRKRT